MFTKKTRVISMIATVCMVISMLACIAVPAYADEFDAIPSVQSVTAAPAADGEYKIASLEDWLWLDGDKESWFRSANITIHLTTDIDLTGAEFNGFHNLKVKFDGHNHTVENWTTGEGKTTNGIFDAVNNANGMVEIKNLKVDNCNIAGANGSAIIYGVSHANAGQSGLPTNVLIENIEVTDSTITNAGSENTAIILSRYASTGAASTVTLRNIKITGSSVIVGSNHAGLLIGKPRGGNSSDPTTYNIQNVILTGNTVRATGAENGNGPAMGLLFGTAENSGATCINMANVYAKDNTLDASLRTNVGIMGTAQSNFVVNAKGVVINDTTASVSEGSSIYLVNAGNRVSFTNVYSNATVAALTSNATEVALSTSKTAADAYVFNEDAGTDSILYWTIDAGELVQATKATAMRKVTTELTNGTPVDTIYAAAGSEVPLAYAADPNATFSTDNEAAAIDGNMLTMPTDGTDVKVIITLGGAGELQQAKDDLQAAIDYYKVDREVEYYVEALATKIEEAEAALLDDTKAAGDYVALTAELEAFADQFVGYPNIPNVAEVEKYSAAPGFTIDDEEDLVWVSAHEGDFTADQTLYLTADLDMTGVNFEGFDSTACFKFNGLNHTIANWTCVKTPADAGDVSMTARTGFFISSNVTRILNVVFDNAQLTGGRESAIVYSTTKGDAVSNKRLEIQNVHVKNSTLNAKGQHSSIIMCNLQDARKAGTGITFCSVIDTTLDFTDKYAGTGNNGSAFLGRVEGSNFTGVVQVQNCYANGFEVINGGANCSVISGPTNLTAAEGASIQTKFYNVAAINCKIEGTTSIGVICARTAGIASYFRDVLIYNCDLTATAEGGYAALAWGNQDWFGNDATYRTRLYFDNTWNQSTWFYNTNAGTTTVLEDIIADPIYFNAETDLGEVAYKLNERSVVDGWQNYFSINEDGDIEPTWANGRYYIDASGNMVVGGQGDAFAADKAAAVRKVTLVQASTGAELKVLYANGGATVDVTYEGAENYALAEGTSATASIDGATLTMSSDFTDVTVLVTLDESSAMETAVTKLVELYDYFNREAFEGEKEADLEAALATAEEIITDSTLFTVQQAEDCLLVLEGFKAKAPYLPRVTEADTYPDAPGYMLWDKTDFEYVSANTAKFNKAITLYMGADIDMSGSSFQRINNVKCDFDGMNHTITNYNPATNAGIFYSYKGTSIKDLTIKNSTAAGGYSRAILVSEAQNPGALVIDNVDMENVTLEASAGGNQMGLYISRTSANGGKITIKNCEVTNCKLTNDSAGATANVNNSGLIIGCIKENHEFLAENIVIKDSSALVDTKAGGMVFGSFETSQPVTIKNVAVIGGELEVGEGVVYGGVMVGIHTRTCPPTFENCMAYGIETNATELTWARGWNQVGGDASKVVTALEIVALNCAADFDGDYVAINNGTGLVEVDLEAGKIMGIEIADDLNGAVWNANGGEAIWTVNAAADDVNLGEKEGYGVPFQITFTSGVGEDASQVGTCYTGIDGKLPASIEWLVNDAMYTWELDGEAVDMETVFTADADVVSTVVHSFEGGELESNEDGTHKVYCTEDHECGIFQTVDCSHKEYDQNADNTHSSVCACGYVLATEDCEIEYTFDEVDSHTGLCETCGRTTPAEECNMSEFTVLPGDEATTEKAGQETSSCDKCDHEEARILNQLAAAKVVAVAEDTSVRLGEDLEFMLKLEGNAAPGLSGAVIKVTYDAEKFTLKGVDQNPVSNFGVVEVDTSVAGEIEIGLIASTPVTAAEIIAYVTLTAKDEAAIAGESDIDVAVYDATLSGTEMDDASTIALDMKAEGLTVAVVDFTPGDVNMDGNISIADVVLVLRVVNGNLTEDQIEAAAADVDGAEGITVADATKLLQYVMGNIDTLA